MKESFMVFGKVQKIMFRQTFIRACHNRGITAGATNDKQNLTLVRCSVEGLESDIIKLRRDLVDLPKLNSWGCHADRIESLKEFIDISSHEVTTSNVTSFKWTKGVEFFL